MAQIIDSLKRLERAGSDYSRATEKLFEAAEDVAAKIEEMIPAVKYLFNGDKDPSTILPRKYYVKGIKSNEGYEKFLCINDKYDETFYIDGIGGYVHNDFNCPIPGQDRTTILQFAKDIAGGWLDEVAEWLGKRTKESNEASEILEKAEEQLKD